MYELYTCRGVSEIGWKTHSRDRWFRKHKVCNIQQICTYTHRNDLQNSSVCTYCIHITVALLFRYVRMVQGTCTYILVYLHIIYIRMLSHLHT